VDDAAVSAAWAAGFDEGVSTEVADGAAAAGAAAAEGLGEGFGFGAGDDVATVFLGASPRVVVPFDLSVAELVSAALDGALSGVAAVSGTVVAESAAGAIAGPAV